MIMVEFNYEIGNIIKDEKRDLIITDREYRVKVRKNRNKYIESNVKWYKYTCNKCGWTEGWIEESNLKFKRGCSCCAGKTIVEGINDIPTTASWMVKYFIGGYDEAKLYGRGSHVTLSFKCPDCGKISDNKVAINNLYKNNSISCKCSDGVSYPNKFIYNIILQLKDQIIYFKSEYSPDWVKPKRYDMYFITKDGCKYIVEMDGGLGHGNKNQYTTHDIGTYNYDELKDNLAKQHDIEVIRIGCFPSYYENIKENILSSRLYEIIDFTNFNWGKCDEDSCKNVIKRVCEYKNKNPNMTTIEIGKIFNIHYSTIIKYLKNGNKFGWCNYDKKEEMSRVMKEYYRTRCKKVICISTNELFKSSEEAHLYHQDIPMKNIRRCCYGGRQTTGVNKLRWRYFDELNDDVSSFLLPKIE